MKPLLKLNAPEQISSGLWVDPPENQPALWKDGENVLFSDGVIEKSAGYSVEATLPSRISDVLVANADGFKRIYAGAEGTVHKSDGGALSQIGSGFSPNGQWVLESFGTWLLATNNVDPPQIWKNTGQLHDWPTCPFPRARIVRKIASVFPVLFHGQSACWPSYNDPEDFVPDIGKRAGQFFIRDLDGDIMAAEPLGDALVYYTQDMFGFMSFVGGEAAMSFKTQQAGGIGAVGPHSVVATGPFHFGMSRKGIWQSDGSSFNYIARPAIARWINEHIDWLQAIDVVAVHHESEQQVAFYFPCLDGVTRGVGYTYAGPAQGRWTILKAPLTAAGAQGVFKAPVIATENTFGFYNTGDNAGAAALPSRLLSAPLDMGSSDRLKRWQMIEIHCEYSGTFQMREGYSNAQKDEPEWTDWHNVVYENWLQDRESVFLTLEFRSQAFGTTWQLSGLEIYGEPVGKTR